MRVRFALAAAALLAAQSALADPLTISQVVQLSAAGIGDDAIVAKIRSSNSHFDLSTDDMVALKAKGVSGPVLAAMITGGNAAGGAPVMSMDAADPAVAHAPGVYYLDSASTPKMARLDPTISSQAKTGGIWGYALTGGIASMSIKATIQNASARLKTSPTPTFFFFFDASNPDSARNSTWLSGTTTTASSPNEFTLVRLVQKSGRREARVGSMNIGGAKTGIMDKDRIEFSYDMVRPGVYKATLTKPLEPGEYGFVYSLAGGGTNGAMTARIFDFAVSDEKIASR